MTFNVLPIGKGDGGGGRKDIEEYSTSEESVELKLRLYSTLEAGKKMASKRKGSVRR